MHEGRRQQLINIHIITTRWSRDQSLDRSLDRSHRVNTPLNCRPATICTPRYRISSTQGIEWPSERLHENDAGIVITTCTVLLPAMVI